MGAVDKLASKEIIRNIHILNNLQDILHKLEEYYSNHASDVKMPSTRRGPICTLCEYVDNLKNEEVYKTLFAKSREELRVDISTLVSDLGSAADEEIHDSINGDFWVIASDFTDSLWMRNMRTEYEGKIQRHF